MAKNSVAHNTPQNQLTSTVLSITVRGKQHEYLYTRITDRCHVLTSLETGKTAQFRSAENLWTFFSELIVHLSNKPTANQQKAISDFLTNAEAYFKTFSTMVNSKVSNYTLNNMQWQLSNAAQAAGLAASRYAQFVSMGI